MNFIQALFGILWFIFFGILFTFLAPWFVTIGTALSVDDFVYYLYWIGLIIMLLFIQIGVPAYYIINARKDIQEGG